MAKKGKEDSKFDKAAILQLTNKLKKDLPNVKIITSEEDYKRIKKVSTGMKCLDIATNGGIPVGRIVQIAGSKSAGKTSLSYKIASQWDHVAWIDIEGVFDYELAKMHGCDPENFSIAQAETLEEAIALVNHFMRINVPLIVVDSIGGMNAEETAKHKDVGYRRVGDISSTLTVELPKIRAVQRKSENPSTIVLINQVRDDLTSVGPFSAPKLPGGHQLEHSTCLLIMIYKSTLITKDILKDKWAIGQNVKFKIDKSRVSVPFARCGNRLYYHTGFVENSDKDIIEEAEKHGRMEILKQIREFNDSDVFDEEDSDE